jgi:hypothetical protein
MIISIPALVRFAPQLAPTVLAGSNPMTDKVLTRCPDCGAPVVNASACLTCPSCGWGKCG